MIYRLDVTTLAATDPAGEALGQQIRELGTVVGPIRTSRIFLIDSDEPREKLLAEAGRLLVDPVIERGSWMDGSGDRAGKSRIEIHLKPGVMDPVAASTEMAMRDLGIAVNGVRTGRAVVIDGIVDKPQLRRIADRLLANGVIESVHFEPFLPTKFEAGYEYQFQLRHVALCDLDDAGLTKLSRQGHLFLSLAEMKAVQNYFRGRHREPTDIELETIAQTWSEHCVHKTLKSAVDVEERDEAGKTVDRRQYKNLIKETIFGSTMELMRRTSGDPFCLSVFSDNAGVIAFDQTDAVCFKAETHNHPSAIEPYGGSATGVGGVIRDILGTGLGAKPIANTDVFCVAFPFDKPRLPSKPALRYAEEPGRTGQTLAPLSAAETAFTPDPLPRGVIHPKRVLQQIVAGVRDYGNRMGIPTVNGAVYFDNRYIGNPLVFCGCIGLIPRDKIAKHANPGDAIVVVGGRTGRDGIHGATFSSAELTDTHADEFSHAVQIGNAITEKKVADVILQARDRNLFTGITDCGAGGLSSAIGEMGEKVGAVVELDRVPLKYAGLRYDEIWISEAQERMVLSVPADCVEPLLKLAAGEDVEATVIGMFGTADRELVLNFRGNEVGRMSMHFLHDGIPTPTRKATVIRREKAEAVKKVAEHGRDARATVARLLGLLAHPNIASKHWIIRQYDHEVQGGSVVKPLTGPLQIGPSDAAVVRPKLGSMRGVAIGCGLSPHIRDPYEMAIASIDEAIRNVICVGANYNQIAILDNFCWPSVDDDLTMGTLVRACEACRDAALAFGIPFISGKDSLHNQFTNQETGEVIRIPPTLLISAIGIVDDVRKCVTMDLKMPGDRVCLVAAKDLADLKSLAETHRRTAAAIASGDIVACHDVSDGGIAVAAAEMCIASGLGIVIDSRHRGDDEAFVERPGRYLVELRNALAIDDLRKHFASASEVADLGTVQKAGELRIGESVVELRAMTAAWRGTLDW